MSQILSKMSKTKRDYLAYFLDQWVRDRCGTSKKWSQGDDQQDYDPVDNLYGPDDITYVYNEHGFRCDPFKNNNAEILFMGCSFTEGTGLPLKDLWSTHVHQELYPNTSYINLGIAGSGIEVQAEALQYFWNETKRPVKDIVFWVPGYWRRFYKVKNNPPWTWLPWQDTFKDPYHDYSLELFMDHDYATHQSMLALGKIKLVAELMQANVHIYDQNHEEQIKRWFPDMHHIPYFEMDMKEMVNDVARDKRHIGPKDSKYVANYIIDNIRKFYER